MYRTKQQLYKVMGAHVMTKAELINKVTNTIK